MAEAAAALLARQGFRGPRVVEEPDGRARLEASFDDGRSALRQIYSVFGDLGFIVSLTAGSAQVPRLAKDLDEAARSLQIAPAAAAPTDGGIAPDAG
jgi:hypothetical protein